MRVFSSSHKYVFRSDPSRVFYASQSATKPHRKFNPVVVSKPHRKFNPVVVSKPHPWSLVNHTLNPHRKGDIGLSLPPVDCTARHAFVALYLLIMKPEERLTSSENWPIYQTWIESGWNLELILEEAKRQFDEKLPASVLKKIIDAHVMEEGLPGQYLDQILNGKSFAINEIDVMEKTCLMQFSTVDKLHAIIHERFEECRDLSTMTEKSTDLIQNFVSTSAMLIDNLEKLANLKQSLGISFKRDLQENIDDARELCDSGGGITVALWDDVVEAVEGVSETIGLSRRNST